MGKRENKVEDYLKKRVKALGGISYKWVSPQVVGVTDQIVIIEGVVWFVEVKTLDGTLSPMQKRRQQELKDNGANVYNVFGQKGVDEFIDCHLFYVGIKNA